MKKILTVLCLFLLVVPIFAKDVPYRIMEFTLVAQNGVDVYLTRHALRSPGFKEVNPLGKFTCSTDFKAILSVLIVSGVQVWGLEQLRKHNKTLGYIVMGAMIIMHGYIIVHNLQLLGKNH